MEIPVDVQKEIQYRQALNEKMYHTNLTESELEWLKTHRSYNLLLGYPYLLTDIICLEPNRQYSVCVENFSQYPTTIDPFFAVSYGKGSIVAEGVVRDRRGKKSLGKKIRNLTLMDGYDTYRFTFSSELGLLSVDYGCWVYDVNQKMNMYRNTYYGGYCAMLREQEGNKYIYRCKYPGKEWFEPCSFTLEFTPI